MDTSIQEKASVQTRTLIDAFEKGQLKALSKEEELSSDPPRPHHPELLDEELAEPGTARKLLQAFEIKRHQSLTLPSATKSSTGRLSVDRFLSFESKSPLDKHPATNGLINGTSTVVLEKEEEAGSESITNVEIIVEDRSAGAVENENLIKVEENTVEVVNGSSCVTTVNESQALHDNTCATSEEIVNHKETLPVNNNYQQLQENATPEIIVHINSEENHENSTDVEKLKVKEEVQEIREEAAHIQVQHAEEQQQNGNNEINGEDRIRTDDVTSTVCETAIIISPADNESSEQADERKLEVAVETIGENIPEGIEVKTEEKFITESTEHEQCETCKSHLHSNHAES